MTCILRNAAENKNDKWELSLHRKFGFVVVTGEAIPDPLQPQHHVLVLPFNDVALNSVSVLS